MGTMMRQWLPSPESARIIHEASDIRERHLLDKSDKGHRNFETRNAQLQGGQNEYKRSFEAQVKGFKNISNC